MKIRTGFVSNSSSSSFILVGATLDKLDIIQTAAHILRDEYLCIDTTEQGEEGLILNENLKDGWVYEYDEITSKYYVGKRLFRTYQDNGVESMSVDKLTAIIEDVKHSLVFKQQDDIRIYSGTLQG